jgi:hypothetical protein
MDDFYVKNNTTLHKLITSQHSNITHNNKYADTIKTINKNINKNEISLLHNWRLMIEENI